MGRSASGVILCRSDGTEAGTTGAMFESERPGSAMSDVSINIPDLASHQSRPPSRLGDEVSGAFEHFSEVPSNYADNDMQQEFQRKMILQEDKNKFYKERREAAEQKEKEEAIAEIKKLVEIKAKKEKDLLLEVEKKKKEEDTRLKKAEIARKDKEKKKKGFGKKKKKKKKKKK